MSRAAALRDSGHSAITFSPKVGHASELAGSRCCTAQLLCSCCSAVLRALELQAEWKASQPAQIQIVHP